MPQTLPRSHPPQYHRRAKAGHHPRAQSPASAHRQVAGKQEDTQPRYQQRQGLRQGAKRGERDEGQHSNDQAAAGFPEAEQPPTEEPAVNEQVSPEWPLDKP